MNHFVFQVLTVLICLILFIYQILVHIVVILYLKKLVRNMTCLFIWCTYLLIVFIYVLNLLILQILMLISIIIITLHYITLHYITLHYITLHYITLHYITLHYITLHYIIDDWEIIQVFDSVSLHLFLSLTPCTVEYNVTKL